MSGTFTEKHRTTDGLLNLHNAHSLVILSFVTEFREGGRGSLRCCRNKAWPFPEHCRRRSCNPTWVRCRPRCAGWRRMPPTGTSGRAYLRIRSARIHSGCTSAEKNTTQLEHLNVKWLFVILPGAYHSPFTEKRSSDSVEQNNTAAPTT